MVDWHGARLWLDYKKRIKLMIENNNFAVVFPGQGSQELGMLKDLADKYPSTKEIFTLASEELSYDLWDLVQNGPVDKLNQTEFTQPALLASSYAIWRVFIESTSFRPKVLAGHSLGEYSALVAANSLDFKDAIKLVAARGRFMQHAVPVGTGAMAAVLGLDNDKIQDVIDKLDTNKTNSVVEIANLNANGQTVIAGSKSAVEASVEPLKLAGAKIVKLLDVSVPSHCSLMQPAADELYKLLETIDIKTPEIPVIHNFSLDTYASGIDIKQALVKQLISPVRWVETIENIYKLGVADIYEFGPGSVLSKLCKRINKDVVCTPVNSPECFNKILEV